MTCHLSIKDLQGSTEYGMVGDKVPFNLNLASGNILCFEGGKFPTLLFRLLMGKGQIEKGEILIGEDSLRQIQLNKDPNAISNWRTKIGICFREQGLLSNMTLFENVALPCRYHNFFKDHHDLNNHVEILLNDANIPKDFWYSRPHSVGWEYRKKAMMARSIALHPKVLIMDGPTNLLGHKEMPFLYKWIKSLVSKDVVVLINSEDLPFALAIGDFMYVESESSSFTTGEAFSFYPNWQEQSLNLKKNLLEVS